MGGRERDEYLKVHWRPGAFRSDEKMPPASGGMMPPDPSHEKIIR